MTFAKGPIGASTRGIQTRLVMVLIKEVMNLRLEGHVGVCHWAMRESGNVWAIASWWLESGC